MSAEKDKAEEVSDQELRVRPFEVAAIATAMWINDSNQESDTLDGSRKIKRPKDFIEDAHELLTAAQQVLVEELVQKERRRAADERRLAAGEYDPSRTFTFKEVLKVQRQKTEDADAMERSQAKFFAGKKWRRLKSRIESGRFHFTDKDLVNRPVGFSVVGTITTLKGLRKTIGRLFPKSAASLLADKNLSMYHIERLWVAEIASRIELIDWR